MFQRLPNPVVGEQTPAHPSGLPVLYFLNRSLTVTYFEY